jgi:hypothetical protein
MVSGLLVTTIFLKNHEELGEDKRWTLMCGATHPHRFQPPLGPICHRGAIPPPTARTIRTPTLRHRSPPPLSTVADLLSP